MLASSKCDDVPLPAGPLFGPRWPAFCPARLAGQFPSPDLLLQNLLAGGPCQLLQRRSQALS